MKTENNKYKRILIIKPSALGDIAMALPALASLRASFPDAKISWLIRPEYALLLAGCPKLDEIIHFDRKFLEKWWCERKAFSALVRFIFRLRRGKFDLVIDLQGLFRTALFGWFTGCKRRFGMASAREFAGVFYTHKIQQDRDSIHVIDYYRKIIIAAGAEITLTDYSFAPNPQAKESIAALLSEQKIDTDKYAVFVPGSARASKCWPTEYFAALAGQVASQYDLSIVGVGSESESALVEHMNSLANVPVVNLAGLTDIGELVALLKNAELVVSNDTGPGHIAAVLDIPIVIIFGETNPNRIHPYNRADSFIAIDAENRGTAIEDSSPGYSVRNITVDQVFEKIALQLNTPTK